MRPTLRASASAVQIGLEPICRAIAAFLQLELFRVYRSNGEANRDGFQFAPLIFPFRLPIFQFVLIVLRKKSCHTRVVGDVR
ncbi:hypothetical protein KU75_07210 [Pectobacterium odoriferum]|uniref:Secreted protein n=1 Tax=Pectobacterium odoriferum TaxID=78398 RepID=A0ABR4VT85_9GAMM|nr:hypothetical protein KU75_07210 [Pectobacterium odoriferum]POE02103.1 hypothetical protein BV916_16810 [Pectobacterium odoriferum]